MNYSPELQPDSARLLLKYVMPAGILAVAAIFVYIIPLVSSSFSDTQALEQSGLSILVYMRYILIIILIAVPIFAIWFAITMFTDAVTVSENTITKKHFFKSRCIAISDITTAEIIDNTNIYALDANRTAGSLVGHLLGCAHKITITDKKGKTLVIEPVNKKMAEIFLQKIGQ